MTLPQPPKPFLDFTTRYPELGQAWELMRKGGQSGPLDEQAQRLVKLGIAIGAMREGAVHSAARKALGAGIPAESLEQVVALAASTIGLPAAVANFTWIRDVTSKSD